MSQFIVTSQYLANDQVDKAYPDVIFKFHIVGSRPNFMRPMCFLNISNFKLPNLMLTKKRLQLGKVLMHINIYRFYLQT